MTNDKIRIATSIPSLKNKVHTKLEGKTDVIYWYIRFNIPLDETTVSDKTMDVTDTEGYIMRTDIHYDEKTHMIVISPLDTYEQNRFYLLNISKKVCSARGQNLHSTIHILFKLLDNQISDYKILKQNVKIPKPKPRPADYDQRQAAKAIRPSVLDQAYTETGPRDQMMPASFSINMLLGILGLLMVGISLYLDIPWLIIVSGVVCVAGLVHVYMQIRAPVLSSTLLFNRGVRLFNKQRYQAAEIAFRKASTANPDNELAKYGLYKAGLYQ
jgi:hypothetical protein